MGNFTLKEKPPIVFFSLFHLKSGYRWWALRQMGLAKKQLREERALQFGELMGTGKGRGFSLQPDFDQYVLFTSKQEFIIS